MTRPRTDLRSVLWLCLAFAGIKLAIQIVGNILAQHAGYGIFRDELYYLVCGQRLAFGYVDQPPLVALQARLTELLFGHDHMWSLRLLSALAGAAKVFLTGLLAWALGGSRRAAALAMLGVLSAGVYLGIDGFLSMNSFDPVFWMLCVLALIRITQAGSEKEIRNWWLVFGASAGLSFENKDSVAFFLIAMLVALLLTPQRRILASRWMAAALGIMLLIALPNFLWQATHHFPTIEFLHNVQVSGKNTKLPPLQFILQQIMMLTPQNVLLWGTGVLWLLLARAARPVRFLGFFFLVFFGLMLTLHGKDYYLAPAYPVFFAAGAVAWMVWAAQKAWRNAVVLVFVAVEVIGLFVFLPFSIPVLPPMQYLAYAKKLHYRSANSETQEEEPLLPQFYADRFGWSDLVEEVARVYHSLPPQEQAVTGIYAQNYGEAGAIDILGRQYDLPMSISGHQNYWLWGPRGYTGKEMILISSASVDEAQQVYTSCKVAGKVDNPLSMPYERRRILLCYGRKTTYQSDWKNQKHYH
ncbi:glycosyltransferase family 39 protein [Edaphobacter paludis]|uniref:Glycosyltransferase family 39 protein n=1 Tax=Edaphobacter paludis TaxID=3035702 RepID=A0AAU7D409_9BACT